MVKLYTFSLAWKKLLEWQPNRFVLPFLLMITLGLSWAFSQPYQAVLGKTSNSWTTLYMIPDIVAYRTVRTLGDTSISGKEYKKLGYFSLADYPNERSTYLREDSVAGKLWLYSDRAKQEYLLMDLSVSVGDTFLLTELEHQYTTRKVAIDSVYIKDGRKHVELKTGNYVGNYVKLTFIEGVGLNMGLVSGSDYSGWASELICSFKDDVQTYLSQDNRPICNGDGVIGSIEKLESLGLDFILSPNPFHDRTVLTFHNPSGDCSLSIFDTKGQLVSLVEHIKSNQITIERGELKSGLYLFKVQNTNKTLASGKLSVE